MHAQKTQTRGAALPRTLRQIHGRGAVLAEKFRHEPLRGRIEEVDGAAAGLRHAHRAFDDELVHRLLLILAENGLAELLEEAEESSLLRDDGILLRTQITQGTSLATRELREVKDGHREQQGDDGEECSGHSRTTGEMSE